MTTTTESKSKRQKTCTNTTSTKTLEKTILHTYWRSSCSWRVRIALGLKAVSYEPIVVNLLNSEQLSEEFMMKNPMHQIPVLEIDGHVMHESLAILEYLEETRPLPALLPTDSYERACVRRLALMICADIQPIQNLRVLKYQTGDKKVWGKHWITLGFTALEEELKKSAGKYCFHDAISFADVCLIPQVYNAQRFDVDMKKFPTIMTVVKNLQQHAVFESAHPKNQPDAVDT